ncbi:MAG: 50S ribosomal protein L18 [Dehalococcoidia bacterium]
MDKTAAKRISRNIRHARIRKQVAGTKSKPRLCVFRSLNNIYAQLIDDSEDKTLLSISSLNSDLKSGTSSKTEKAKMVGERLAKRATELGITEIVFDRAGYKYHGRVKALADASREAGIKF